MNADIFISAIHQIISVNSQKWPLQLEINIHSRNLIFNSKFLRIKCPIEGLLVITLWMFCRLNVLTDSTPHSQIFFIFHLPFSLSLNIFFNFSDPFMTGYSTLNGQKTMIPFLVAYFSASLMNWMCSQWGLKDIMTTEYSEKGEQS